MSADVVEGVNFARAVLGNDNVVVGYVVTEVVARVGKS